jgi:hypothetical protein
LSNSNGSSTQRRDPLQPRSDMVPTRESLAHHSDSFIAVHVFGDFNPLQNPERSPLPGEEPESMCRLATGELPGSPDEARPAGSALAGSCATTTAGQSVQIAATSPKTVRIDRPSEVFDPRTIPSCALQGRPRHSSTPRVRRESAGLGTSRIGVTEHIPSAPELRTKAFSHRRRPIQNLRSRREHLMRPGPLCLGL